MWFIMGKDYTNKYISTVKHETLTNQGKIDNLDSLWSHYQNLQRQTKVMNSRR